MAVAATPSTTARNNVVDENWFRIITYVNYGGHKLCLDILHQKEGAPVDGGQLHNLLVTKRVKFGKLLDQNQYDLILPDNGITDTDGFDIPLFTMVIFVLYGKKYKKVIDELRNWRNKVFHKGIKRYTNEKFQEKWNDLTTMFEQNGLRASDFTDLKTCILDTNSVYRSAYLEALSEDTRVLKEDIVEMKQRLHIIENPSTSGKKENIMEKSAPSDPRWRRIHRGVVLKLDISQNEEIQKVDCCKTNNVKDSFVIKHKTCVRNKEDQYYETHLVNDTLMLLKIENMEDGNYKIDVTTQSTLISFAVDVNHQQTNPTFDFGKTCIEVPSSDWKEFWQEMKYAIRNCGEHVNCEIVLSEGASTRLHTFKDFEEMGKKYLQRNFDDEDLVTCFKPTHLLDNETLKGVIDFFKKLFTRKCCIKIFILVSPDLDYHVAIINNKKDLLKEMKRGFQPYLLIFVEEKSLVMVVRVVLDAQLQHDTINTCQHDVLNFVKINGCKLGKEKFNIVGVIACPFIKRDQLKDLLPFQFASCRQHLYNKFFLCEEELQLKGGYEMLDKWWNTIRKTNVDGDNNLLFSSLIGPHMALMASVQEGLPTLDDCAHQQLLTLLLNPSQITAIDSNDKKKLITGPFGSGKSLVGQRILRKMGAEILQSGEPGMFAYISCDPYTIIDAHVKSTMQGITDNNDNLTFLCGSMHNLFKVYIDQDLSKVSLDVLIKVLTTKYKHCGFVIDEINQTSMTEEVAKNINESLSAVENSRIVFIQQSISKERTYTDNGKDHLLQANHFSLIDNLKHHPLQHVMRLTWQNQQLVDCTQRIIKQQTVEVFLPESQTIEPQQSRSVGARIPSIQQSPQSTSVELSSSQTPPIAQVRESASFPDFDVSLRWMANSQPLATSNQMISTNFGFVDGKEGHNIEYRKPEIYYLPESIPSELDNVKILCQIFNVRCFQDENPVCIAYSIESARVFYRISKSCKKYVCLYIPYLQQRIPSLKEKEQVLRNMQEPSVVLITDHRSFIGMEAKNVVTIADPKERYMRHSIVEIASRCTMTLKLFVRFYNKFEKGSMNEIFKGWKDEQLVEVTNIVLETQKETDRPIKISPTTNAIIVHAKCIMQHDLYELSIDEQKIFQVTQHHEHMSNFVQSQISPFQSFGGRIFHHVEVDGKRLSFQDVRSILVEKRFGLFERIVQNHPNVLNNLRNDNNNDTLLMTATGQREIIEYLMKTFHQQIHYRAQDRNGLTAFHWAALRNNITVMKFLISKDRRGLEDQQPKVGWTPLHWATLNGHELMIECLLKHGADPHAKDVIGQTADQMTQDKECTKLIQHYQTKNRKYGLRHESFIFYIK